MRSRVLCLLSVISLLATVHNARAWSDGGHLLIAAIAYKQLPPAARTNVAKMLKHHPSFATWKQQASKSPEIPLDEFIFMRAGLWADDIKYSRHPDRAENKPSWHYVNYPLVPPGDPMVEPTGGDLHRAISNCVGALKATGETPARKAIALAWLIHLVADLHQPLHNTTLIIPRLSKAGDKGGNDFFIQPGAKPINLHFFWDGLLGTSDNVRTHRNEAIRLAAAMPRSAFPQLATAKNPVAWSLEARQLAISTAYRGLDLTRGTEADPAPLPADYAKNCKAVAERQAVLAGYRLAALLARSSIGTLRPVGPR